MLVLCILKLCYFSTPIRVNRFTGMVGSMFKIIVLRMINLTEAQFKIGKGKLFQNQPGHDFYNFIRLYILHI